MCSSPSCSIGSASRNPGSPDCFVPKHIAAAAQPKILVGDEEAIVGVAQQRQPAPGRVVHPVLVQQQAEAGRGAAPDTAAQLMQLRQTEAFGVLDHHHRGRRHIDADLDHRRRHQQPASRRRRTPPASRRAPRRPAGRAPGPPRRRTARAARRTAPRRRRRRAPRSPRPAGRPNRPARPRPACAPPHPARSGSVPSECSDGADRLPAGRLLGQAADLHLAPLRQQQRARDRRRGHHQHVGAARPCRRAAAADRRRTGAARRSPPAPGRGIRHALLEQRVRADDQRHRAVLQCRAAAARACAPLHASRSAAPPAPATGATACGDAASPAPRSAPSARPACRPRPRAASPAAPPASCPSRHRLAAAAACGDRTPDRRRSRPAPAPARR